MIRLLLALLMIPAIGKAEVLFETTNKGGGKIVLTDEYCNDGKHRLAYATHPDIDTQMAVKKVEVAQSIYSTPAQEDESNDDEV